MKKYIFTLILSTTFLAGFSENPREKNLFIVNRFGGNGTPRFAEVISWSDGSATHVRCNGIGNLTCKAIANNGDLELDDLLTIAQERMLNNRLRTGKISNGNRSVAWQASNNFEQYKIWEIVE